MCGNEKAGFILNVKSLLFHQILISFKYYKYRISFKEKRKMAVYNFSAGPSMLPKEVLEEAQKELLSFNGSGMSITEISHRSKLFTDLNTELEDNLRTLMNVPENYKIIFVQGGASTQFEAVPLNLLGGDNKKADYIVTGNFAKKAYKEAIKYGDIACAGSSEAETFTSIPEYTIRDGVKYVHITTNNTIFGLKYDFNNLPDTKGAILVGDLSSNILSEKCDVSKFGVIYAGAQKNIAPAGVTIVIVREDLLGSEMDICPTMMKWSTQVKESSLYNTPPCFSMYIANLVLRRLRNLGGVEYIEKINKDKAQMLYDFIDNSSLYKNNVKKSDRSIMNVPFVTGSDELDAKFVKEAAACGLNSLKGHRLVGGMRASIYNAMPVEGVQALIDFMKKFESENK